MRRFHHRLRAGLRIACLLGIVWPAAVPAQAGRGEGVPRTDARWVEPGQADTRQTGDPGASPERIDVFLIQDRPVVVPADLHRRLATAGIRLFLHDLDAPRRLEAELSRGLPADPQAAFALARQRLEAAGRDGALARRLASAYQGLTVALELRVDRLPAVVFGAGGAGEPVVVYGVDDLEVAIRLYLAWREGRSP